MLDIGRFPDRWPCVRRMWSFLRWSYHTLLSTGRGEDKSFMCCRPKITWIRISLPWKLQNLYSCPRRFPSKFSMYFMFFTYVLHAQPIATTSLWRTQHNKTVSNTTATKHPTDYLFMATGGTAQAAIPVSRLYFPLRRVTTTLIGWFVSCLL